MYVIKIDKNGHKSRILCNDHKPNPAFVNEFQTTSFTLKLEFIEQIEGDFCGYKIDEGSYFVLYHMHLRNNTNEEICIFSDDFQLNINKHKLYLVEEYLQLENQFENECILNPWEEKKGYYLFVVSNQIVHADLFYCEYYDEEYEKQYHLRYKFV